MICSSFSHRQKRKKNLHRFFRSPSAIFPQPFFLRSSIHLSTLQHFHFKLSSVVRRPAVNTQMSHWNFRPSRSAHIVKYVHFAHTPLHRRTATSKKSRAMLSLWREWKWKFSHKIIFNGFSLALSVTFAFSIRSFLVAVSFSFFLHNVWKVIMKLKQSSFLFLCVCVCVVKMPSFWLVRTVVVNANGVLNARFLRCNHTRENYAEWDSKKIADIARVYIVSSLSWYASIYGHCIKKGIAGVRLGCTTMFL